MPSRICFPDLLERKRGIEKNALSFSPLDRRRTLSSIRLTAWMTDSGLPGARASDGLGRDAFQFLKASLRRLQNEEGSRMKGFCSKLPGGF